MLQLHNQAKKDEIKKEALALSKLMEIYDDTVNDFIDLLENIDPATATKVPPPNKNSQSNFTPTDDEGYGESSEISLSDRSQEPSPTRAHPRGLASVYDEVSEKESVSSIPERMNAPNPTKLSPFMSLAATTLLPPIADAVSDFIKEWASPEDHEKTDPSQQTPMQNVNQPNLPPHQGPWSNPIIPPNQLGHFAINYPPPQFQQLTYEQLISPGQGHTSKPGYPPYYYPLPVNPLIGHPHGPYSTIQGQNLNPYLQQLQNPPSQGQQNITFGYQPQAYRGQDQSVAPESQKPPYQLKTPPSQREMALQNTKGPYQPQNLSGQAQNVLPVSQQPPNQPHISLVQGQTIIPRYPQGPYQPQNLSGQAQNVLPVSQQPPNQLHISLVQGQTIIPRYPQGPYQPQNLSGQAQNVLPVSQQPPNQLQISLGQGQTFTPGYSQVPYQPQNLSSQAQSVSPGLQKPLNQPQISLSQRQTTTPGYPQGPHYMQSTPTQQPYPQTQHPPASPVNSQTPYTSFTNTPAIAMGSFPLANENATAMSYEQTPPPTRTSLPNTAPPQTRSSPRATAPPQTRSSPRATTPPQTRSSPDRSRDRSRIHDPLNFPARSTSLGPLNSPSISYFHDPLPFQTRSSFLDSYSTNSPFPVLSTSPTRLKNMQELSNCTSQDSESLSYADNSSMTSQGQKVCQQNSADHYDTFFDELLTFLNELTDAVNVIQAQRHPL